MKNLSYNNIKQSGAVKASYNNNIFTLQSSKVGEIELLISPVMVNLQNPVIVTINGKEVFNKRLSSDKTFLLNEFQKKYDRLALWVTSIKLKVD